MGGGVDEGAGRAFEECVIALAIEEERDLSHVGLPIDFCVCQRKSVSSCEWLARSTESGNDEKGSLTWYLPYNEKAEHDIGGQ